MCVYIYIYPVACGQFRHRALLLLFCLPLGLSISMGVISGFPPDAFSAMMENTWSARARQGRFCHEQGTASSAGPFSAR